MVLLGIWVTLSEAGSIYQVGSAYLTPARSSVGAKTFYQFMFRTSTAIQRSAKVEIVFPQEFTVYDFDVQVRCYLREDSSAAPAYAKVACAYAAGNVITLSTDTLGKANYTVQIGEVANPTLYASSSSFQLRTLLNDVVVDRNEVFGQVSFSPAPRNRPHTYIYLKDFLFYFYL